MWKEFKNSRLALYLLYGLTYLIFWKVVGFEFTVIMMLSLVLGEQHYQDKNKF